MLFWKSTCCSSNSSCSGAFTRPTHTTRSWMKPQQICTAAAPKKERKEAAVLSSSPEATWNTNWVVLTSWTIQSRNSLELKAVSREATKVKSTCLEQVYQHLQDSNNKLKMISNNQRNNKPTKPNQFNQSSPTCLPKRWINASSKTISISKSRRQMTSPWSRRQAWGNSSSVRSSPARTFLLRIRVSRWCRSRRIPRRSRQAMKTCIHKICLIWGRAWRTWCKMISTLGLKPRSRPASCCSLTQIKRKKRTLSLWMLIPLIKLMPWSGTMVINTTSKAQVKSRRISPHSLRRKKSRA